MEKSYVVIEPSVAAGAYWSDLWRYRALLGFLAWRDLLLRYKQTVLGVAWAVAPSLLTAGLFSLVFGRFARLPSDGVPYPLFVLTAALPWNLFASGLSQGGSSLVANAHLLSKVYFPRLVIPLSAVLVSAVDFGISGVVLLVLVAVYGRGFHPRMLLAVPLSMLALAAATGGGLWIAALQARYRDFRYVVPLLVQLGLYASPIGFSSALVPQRWRDLYDLNPLVGVVEGFRWAILGGGRELDVRALTTSALVSGALLLSGFLYFRKTENTLADVI